MRPPRRWIRRTRCTRRSSSRSPDDAPIVPVAYQKALYGVSKDVVGFRPYVRGTYGLKETKLKH